MPRADGDHACVEQTLKYMPLPSLITKHMLNTVPTKGTNQAKNHLHKNERLRFKISQRILAVNFTISHLESIAHILSNMLKIFKILYCILSFCKKGYCDDLHK